MGKLQIICSYRAIAVGNYVGLFIQRLRVMHAHIFVDDQETGENSSLVVGGLSYNSRWSNLCVYVKISLNRGAIAMGPDSTKLNFSTLSYPGCVQVTTANSTEGHASIKAEEETIELTPHVSEIVAAYEAGNVPILKSSIENFVQPNDEPFGEDDDETVKQVLELVDRIYQDCDTRDRIDAAKQILSRMDKESKIDGHNEVTFAEHEENLEEAEGSEQSPTKTKTGPTSLNIAARKWARDGDVWVGPFLTISPAEELEFCVTDENKETLDILSLTNSSEKHVAFKVKTTSPEKYRVRPSTGVVKPGGSYDISVYLHSGNQSTILKDKFLVMFTEISHPMPASQVNELFRTATRDMYNEHRLRCRLGSLKNENEAKPASPADVSQQLAELTQQVKRMSEVNERLESRVSRMLLFQFFLLLILLMLGSAVVLTVWNGDYRPINALSHNACMPWYAS